jgi:hypothetical protein
MSWPGRWRLPAESLLPAGGTERGGILPSARQCCPYDKSTGKRKFRQMKKAPSSSDDNEDGVFLLLRKGEAVFTLSCL